MFINFRRRFFRLVDRLNDFENDETLWTVLYLQGNIFLRGFVIFVKNES